MKKMLHDTIVSIIQFLFDVFTNTTVIGTENVPMEGGFILATNHVSRLDPALAYVVLNRPNMTALVADKYKTYPGINWLVEIFQGIWLDREDADYKALREARNFLRNGGLLGIAPEGTRSHTGSLTEAKTGVAFLADKAGVPIIPIAVWGTEKAFSELVRFKRANITIVFGKPFKLPPIDRNDRTGSLKRNTDEIMCHIAAMLPPEYRGVYADHPCTLELLANQQGQQKSTISTNQ